ncbi:uncharacterized protein PHACADRAFT_256901 [Phanerochaete carnosa HHB-10118-sp]|uniref:Uncharacterized protein n=1 Tax=Phanerochaete carnosa (strain HHB-10118-sp) TaxID=650164 RepID=K5WZL4_PHACS|nr:uncharacterized protein PHACADRAFT_256901 [Phanerochaete carnosa HHB-10118-sp]EKM55942.1 hypothetical protein PHACADRAFT_256901 [Phanerochaete carnosa HHB-10118-sp]
MIRTTFLIIFAAAVMVAHARDCKWSGTAPFCSGTCTDEPYLYEVTKGCGGGDSGSECWSGYKAFCCTERDDCENCYWDGTAPACDGSCPHGKQLATDLCGDGARCAVGLKAYCAPNNEASKTSSPATHQTHIEAAGKSEAAGRSGHYITGHVAIGKVPDL